MNSVEIEETVLNHAAQPFDPAEFPVELLRTFENKETTIQLLRSWKCNEFYPSGGVLQRSNIHIATCQHGQFEAELPFRKAGSDGE